MPPSITPVQQRLLGRHQSAIELLNRKLSIVPSMSSCQAIIPRSPSSTRTQRHSMSPAFYPSSRSGSIRRNMTTPLPPPVSRAKRKLSLGPWILTWPKLLDSGNLTADTHSIALMSKYFGTPSSPLSSVSHHTPRYTALQTIKDLQKLLYVPEWKLCNRKLHRGAQVIPGPLGGGPL